MEIIVKQIFLWSVVPLATLVARQDSSRVIPLQENNIWGKPSMLAGGTRASLVSTLRVAEARFGAAGISAAIAALPGVFVKDYGGDVGIKTISQRGMGAEHTPVYLNGFRLSSTQNGLTDLGAFGGSSFGELSLVRGGASSTLGADAVSGALNIVSGSPEAPLSFYHSVGSFGSATTHISAGWNGDKVAAALELGKQKSDGDFPFEFVNGSIRTQLVRANADLQATWAALYARAAVSDVSKFIAFARVYRSDRGVPARVVSATPTSFARLSDDDFITQMRYSFIASGGALASIGAQVRSVQERYSDSLLNVGGQPLDSYFKNSEARLTSTLEMNYGTNSRIVFGAEAAAVRGVGTALSNEVTRRQASGFVSLDHQLDFLPRVFTEIIVAPSVRVDAVSSFPREVSGRVAVLARGESVGLMDPIVFKPAVRISAGKNFRLPTFNELYWSGGGGFGNPRLNPERANSFDLGAEVESNWQGSMKCSLTYFLISMQNRIVWMSAGTGGVTPRNVRAVASEGIEAEAEWQSVLPLLSARVSYTRMATTKVGEDFAGDPNVGKQIPFVPIELLSGMICYNASINHASLKSLAASIRLDFQSHRFTTDDNLNFLPAFATADCSFAMFWEVDRLGIESRASVRNLTDQRYAFIQSYPIPGRSVTLEVVIQLHSQTETP